MYTIVKKIGDGGFSSIYHVYDKNRKSYAVKIVNLLKSDGYTDKDLMNEINLLTVILQLSRTSYLTKLHFLEFTREPERYYSPRLGA